MIDGYYNRFDPNKEYDEHLFRAGKVLQSAEVNELQSAFIHRVRGIADTLFKDGDVIRDARVIVDADTGGVICESGALYLQGAVRGIQPKTFTIPVVGVIAIGVRLTTRAITELEDPGLRDPATLTRNYQEAGAGRKQVHLEWSFQGDETEGEFFPVYQVEDGVVVSKEPPPNIDAVTNAIASYDRQSTGGTYVVEGMHVRQLDDDVSGNQVYSVQEGSARVFGRAVTLSASRRVVYPSTPDLGNIDSEPHLSTTVSEQRIDTDRFPVAEITQVRITAQKTATVTHGQFVGAQDDLPDTAVLEILSVVQGGTTYVAGTDYKLTAGRVDWSLTGDEPALGSQYQVTYRYINTVLPTDVDATGFTVTGAVVGTLVQVTYKWKRPRYDRLCLNAEGSFQWVLGVPANDAPRVPQVPAGLMLLATIHQTWGATRTTRNDGVRVIPMQDIETIRSNVADLYDLMAEQRLMQDASSREPAATKGLFVDSFRNNEQRDAGIAQGAVIDGGELVLPVSTAIDIPGSPITTPQTLPATHVVTISQLGRTGSMKVNPYQAFDPIPAPVKLTPAVDHHVTTNVTWAASIWGSSWTTETLSSARTEHSLRQIDVRFNISGFGPSEQLISVTFDGVDVTDSVLEV